MQALLQMNYPVPNGTLLPVAVFLGFAALLVVWPLAESLTQCQLERGLSRLSS